MLSPTEQSLFDAAEDIGGVLECNCGYLQMLASNIEDLGKPLSELTIGQLQRLITSTREQYNRAIVERRNA